MSRAHCFLSGLGRKASTVLFLCLSTTLVQAQNVSVGASVGYGDCASCGTVSGSGPRCECGPFFEKCCPPVKYFYEGPPRLRFKKACPRPICDPCNLPHYGYFRTCWHRWPWPPDWSHCPTPPPGAYVPASVGKMPVLPEPEEGTGGNKPEREEKAPPPRPTTKNEAPSPLPVETASKAKPLPTQGGQELSSVEPPVEKGPEMSPRSGGSLTDLLPEPAKQPVAPQPKKVDGPVSVIAHRTVRLNVVPELLGEIIPGKTRVELWYTQDAKKWYHDEMVAQQKPPFEVAVQSDGLYGFTVRALNEVGLKQPQPKSGTAPQIWVKVDTRRPVVQIVSVSPLVTNFGRSLRLRWKATDENFSNKPISITWATNPRGPWTPLTTNQENTGLATLQLPARIPSLFYLRVEAVDLAGNVGIAQTGSSIVLPVLSMTGK